MKTDVVYVKVWCQSCRKEFSINCLEDWKCHTCRESNIKNLHRVDPQGFIIIKKENFKDILPESLWYRYNALVDCKSPVIKLLGLLEYNTTTDELQ